jgi:hypothetical protein
MSSTCTDVTYSDILDTLSFSFPFPPPMSSIENFHCYRHVLHKFVYGHVCLFLCICLCFGYIFHI